MNVLITGAAGFIGSNLVHYLVEKRPSWKITALDFLTYAGNMKNIFSLVDEGRISFAKVNIVDAGKVGELFVQNQFDLVLHLAAESHVDRSIHSAAEFVLTNVVGTQNLLSAARETKVSRFVHISTDEVYGSIEEGRFTEKSPLDPTSPYAASKASSDVIALSYFKTFGFEVLVTRCTNNYGPFQFPEKFIPLFITNAIEDKPLPLYGDGMNVRSWIHVQDHCEALLRVAEGGTPGECYNVGGFTEAEVPNLVVAQMILKKLGKSESLLQPVVDRLAHDRRYAVDASKIGKELGWSPQIPFEKGIEETISWYMTHTSWWEEIKTGAYIDFYQKNYANRNI